jgi:ribonuclease HI
MGLVLVERAVRPYKGLGALAFDGACRPKTGFGEASWGAVLWTGKKWSCMQTFLGEGCGPLGRTTNNAAEFVGLLHGLELALEAGVSKILAYGDSNLVIMTVMGYWKLKAPHLVPLRKRVRTLLWKFERFKLKWHSRESWRAVAADRKANEALDLVVS